MFQEETPMLIPPDLGAVTPYIIVDDADS